MHYKEKCLPLRVGAFKGVICSNMENTLFNYKGIYITFCLIRYNNNTHVKGWLISDLCNVLYFMAGENNVSFVVWRKADLAGGFFILLDFIRRLQQDATDDDSVLQQTVFKRGTTAAASRAQRAQMMSEWCMMGTGSQSWFFFSMWWMLHINNVNCLPRKWTISSHDPGIDLQFSLPNLPARHNLTTHTSRCRSATCGPFTCDPSVCGSFQDKQFCFRDSTFPHPSTVNKLALRSYEWNFHHCVSSRKWPAIAPCEMHSSFFQHLTFFSAPM